MVLTGRVVAAYGAGRLVNPKLARSQCIGEMIGGIGMALMEHSVSMRATAASRMQNLPSTRFRSYSHPQIEEKLRS
jgi:xanthine dehydrogenase YagR molybdenum-binding subunit